MSNPTYIPSADAAREGYLTADEVRELQAICNRFRSAFYIIGSRALGEGRNIHQNISLLVKVPVRAVILM